MKLAYRKSIGRRNQVFRTTTFITASVLRKLLERTLQTIVKIMRTQYSVRARVGDDAGVLVQAFTSAIDGASR